MTIERRGSYSESREAGVGRIPAIFGRRAWFELHPGSHTTGGSMTVLDEDTVQIREETFPGSHTAWPHESLAIYKGEAVNVLPGLRWRGDTNSVKPAVTERSGPYMPDNFEEELARRDRAYARRHPIDRLR